jgi:xylulose-5-phosphate/fructose-6-phosphate phosphoketolase
LNDGKIGSPTVLGRESDVLIRARFESYGYEVIFVEGDEPLKVHQDYAKAQEYAYAKIRAIQREARANGPKGVAGFGRPKWPLIVLRTPKGWTGPKKVDDVQIEGTSRSHQVPLSGVRDNSAHLAQLEGWLRSYRPEELFTKEGALREELQALTPKGSKRMGATPYANGGGHNGGRGAHQLQIPPLEKYAVKVTSPGGDARQCSTAQLGQLCRDLYGSNPTSFRFFCPDETASNRFQALYETQQRAWQQTVKPEIDEALGPQGRVMEVLSEHNVNGWLEGYILTGRHALLATYEAFSMVSWHLDLETKLRLLARQLFIHSLSSLFFQLFVVFICLSLVQVFLSMTLQTVKWLEVVAGSDKELPLTWRKPVPSVNILLTSTCVRNN